MELLFSPRRAERRAGLPHRCDWKPNLAQLLAARTRQQSIPVLFVSGPNSRIVSLRALPELPLQVRVFPSTGLGD